MNGYYLYCLQRFVATRRTSSGSTALPRLIMESAYRKVDLHSGRMPQTQTIGFLMTVVRNPRLGSRALSLRPQTINYYIVIASTGEFVGFLAYAAQFLPDRKTFVIHRCYGGVPDYFKWNAPQTPSFQLQHLSLQIEPSPRCINLHKRFTPAPSAPVEPPSSLSLCLNGVEVGCPSLEIVEATSSVIQLLLLKWRVKSLPWEWDDPGPLGAGHDLEMGLGPCHDIFRPELCKAYGHLENLVICAPYQISFLPALSVLLILLKTLRLSLWEDIYISKAQSLPLGNEFMRAMGKMRYLEVLVIGWPQDGTGMTIDPTVVFAVSRSLKYFSFFAYGSPGTRSTLINTESGTGGGVEQLP